MPRESTVPPKPMSVVRFAAAMEDELRANSHKGGWRHMTTRWLLMRLRQEVAELGRAVEAGKTERAVLSEAADVGNFAMMIADVYYKPDKPKRQRKPHG